jgi:hypothetical protein
MGGDWEGRGGQAGQTAIGLPIIAPVTVLVHEVRFM